LITRNIKASLTKLKTQKKYVKTVQEYEKDQTFGGTDSLNVKMDCENEKQSPEKAQ